MKVWKFSIPVREVLSVSFCHVNNETTKKDPTYQFLSSALISSSLEIRSLSLSSDLTLRQNLFERIRDNILWGGYREYFHRTLIYMSGNIISYTHQLLSPAPRPGTSISTTASIIMSTMTAGFICWDVWAVSYHECGEGGLKNNASSWWIYSHFVKGVDKRHLATQPVHSKHYDTNLLRIYYRWTYADISARNYFLALLFVGLQLSLVSPLFIFGFFEGMWCFPLFWSPTS